MALSYSSRNVSENLLLTLCILYIHEYRGEVKNKFIFKYYLIIYYLFINLYFIQNSYRFIA